MSSSSRPIQVLVAKTIHTLEPGTPHAEAIAVKDDRIISVGTLAQVEASLAGHDWELDQTHSDDVIVPGLIDQHMHPLLAATTLMTEIVATEDWVLPRGSYPAAHSAEEYVRRLRDAHDRRSADGDADGWMFSWGHHHLWHGKLTREVLDSVSETRPIGVWQRSCHEFFLNTPAIEALGITQEWLDDRANDMSRIADYRAATAMINLDEGHFWEGGFFVHLMGKVGPLLLNREVMEQGLHQLVAYLHQHGVVAFNEPGISWGLEPFDLYQEILGADDAPFLSTFLIDARTGIMASLPDDEIIANANEQVQRAPEGKVRVLDRQVKFFADGAIIAQLMQMRDPYLDANGDPDPHHHGEWMMEPETFAHYFKIYWDAGWQIHTHVNGDLGLDMVLDTMEACMVENPRNDHRCVIVHFANSTEEQVDRIARLGAIVSANPYYPCGFADKYASWGLGPERADVMVRSRSVLDRHIPLSFHSDMPMAQADPLRLASYGAERRTQSGRVAGPEQRIGRLEALQAVTLGAAHSWRMEHDLGSIATGKLAHFTVLGADPLDASTGSMDDAPIRGVIFGGRWFPTPTSASSNSAGASVSSLAGTNNVASHEHGCGCEAARHVATWVRQNAA